MKERESFVRLIKHVLRGRCWEQETHTSSCQYLQILLYYFNSPQNLIIFYSCITIFSNIYIFCCKVTETFRSMGNKCNDSQKQSQHAIFNSPILTVLRTGVCYHCWTHHKISGSTSS